MFSRNLKYHSLKTKPLSPTIVSFSVCISVSQSLPMTLSRALSLLFSILSILALGSCLSLFFFFLLPPALLIFSLLPQLFLFKMLTI